MKLHFYLFLIVISIKPCHACNAYGQLKCSGCDGTGRKICGSCNGQRVRTHRDASGNVNQSPCGSCQSKYLYFHIGKRTLGYNNYDKLKSYWLSNMHSMFE